MLPPSLVIAIVAVTSAFVQEAGPEKLEPRPGLENLLKLSPRLYSGGEPQGREGFRSLEELGIRTVVSVDAAKPDVEAAREHGLRYVQIPIGYDGVEPEAAAAMAKALKECEAPIYVHCHHGKHRGPAMAAVALRLDTACPASDAVKVLEMAGTGKDYDGLWHDVERFNAASIDGLDVTLYETAPVGDIEAEMAAIDRIWDRLKLCRDAEWKTPADHPDIAPAHEALMMEERLRELLRQETTPNELAQGLEESRLAAEGLHKGLSDAVMDDVELHFAALQASCKQCHAQFRN